MSLCKDGIYEDGGGSGKAYCNVLYIIRPNGSSSLMLSIQCSEAKE